MENTSTATYRLPAAGWRESYDGSLICPHRDLSVCGHCAKQFADTMVDVHGRFFYDPTGEVRKALGKYRSAR